MYGSSYACQGHCIWRTYIPQKHRKVRFSENNPIGSVPMLNITCCCIWYKLYKKHMWQMSSIWLFRHMLWGPFMFWCSAALFLLLCSPPIFSEKRFCEKYLDTCWLANHELVSSYYFDQIQSISSGFFSHQAFGRKLNANKCIFSTHTYKCSRLSFFPTVLFVL